MKGVYSRPEGLPRHLPPEELSRVVNVLSQNVNESWWGRCRDVEEYRRRSVPTPTIIPALRVLQICSLQVVPHQVKEEELSHFSPTCVWEKLSYISILWTSIRSETTKLWA